MDGHAIPQIEHTGGAIVRIQLWRARGIPAYLVCKIDEETGTYLTDEENSRLVQIDYDFPSLAESFGWSLRESQPELHWFVGSGRIELRMTMEQAESVSHSGQCDEDVLELSRVPEIREQLEKIDPETLSAELREYGAWDEEERKDHPQNLQRILWLAGGDIKDNPCTHDSTDGTVKCETCGRTPTEFISDAAEYLDANIGKIVEDVGYFE
jgi:hypothetical protein